MATVKLNNGEPPPKKKIKAFYVYDEELLKTLTSTTNLTDNEDEKDINFEELNVDNLSNDSMNDESEPEAEGLLKKFIKKHSISKEAVQDLSEILREIVSEDVDINYERLEEAASEYVKDEVSQSGSHKILEARVACLEEKLTSISEVVSGLKNGASGSNTNNLDECEQEKFVSTYLPIYSEDMFYRFDEMLKEDLAFSDSFSNFLFQIVAKHPRALINELLSLIFTSTFRLKVGWQSGLSLKSTLIGEGIKEALKHSFPELSEPTCQFFISAVIRNYKFGKMKKSNKGINDS